MNAERAIVYRGGRRRFFTARAAAHEEARAAWWKKYPCECVRLPADPDRPLFDTGLCDSCGAEDGPEIRARLARFILRAFRQSLILTPDTQKRETDI